MLKTYLNWLLNIKKSCGFVFKSHFIKFKV